MDKKTQRTAGIHRQSLSISPSPDAASLQPGEFVEIRHRGQAIPARLQPTRLPQVQHVVALGHGQYPSEFPPALPTSETVSSHERIPTALDDPMQRQFTSQPASMVECDVSRVVDPYRPGVFDIYEADPEFQLSLPKFMDKWLEGDSGRRDSYELPEVGAPPGKRSWPFASSMSPGHLMDLHDSMLPTLKPSQPLGVQSFDSGEASERSQASSNPQKLTPKALELPGSRHPIDELGMTRVLSSGDPMGLDPAAFVDAVKELELGSNWRTLLALQKKSSFDKMVSFAKKLGGDQGISLLNQARQWIGIGIARRGNSSKKNPEASQLMALLYLFTSCTPGLSGVPELMSLLPLTWPPVLEHLRKECLGRRAALAKQKSSARTELLVRLNERYGG